MCSRPGPSCTDIASDSICREIPRRIPCPRWVQRKNIWGSKHRGKIYSAQAIGCRHPAPAFFLERACLTGIEAANAVLTSRGLQTWALVEYLPPEPFVAWIEKLMKRGRQKRKQKRMNR